MPKPDSNQRNHLAPSDSEIQDAQLEKLKAEKRKLDLEHEKIELESRFGPT